MAAVASESCATPSTLPMGSSVYAESVPLTASAFPTLDTDLIAIGDLIHVPGEYY